jgi:hypothetical protein
MKEYQRGTNLRSVSESHNSDLPSDTTRTGVRSSRKSNLISGKLAFAANISEGDPC